MDKLDSRLFDFELKSWSMEREMQSIKSKLDITRDDIALHRVKSFDLNLLLTQTKGIL